MSSEAVLLALIGLIGTLVGVVIWLIKLNAERAAKAQDALTTTLQSTIANQRDQIATYGSGFTQLTETMKSGFASVNDGRNEAVRRLEGETAAVMAALNTHTKALDEILAALPAKVQP